MSELDKLYMKLLHHGLNALRNAARSGDVEHCTTEAEHLHNIPSLVGEDNIHRHIYYTTKERVAYQRWAAGNSREHVGILISYYYEPIWREMDKLLRADQV